MPIDAIQRSGRTLRIVVGDALTTRDAMLVRDALALEPRDATVTVDLRRARTSEPQALLVLSRALADADGRLALVGLTRVQARLLRYLEAVAAPGA